MAKKKLNSPSYQNSHTSTCKDQRKIYGNYAHVPEIKLEGKWLEKLDFELGGEVMVKQQKGKLTITPKKRENE